MKARTNGILHQYPITTTPHPPSEKIKPTHKTRNASTHDCFITLVFDLDLKLCMVCYIDSCVQIHRHGACPWVLHCHQASTAHVGLVATYMPMAVLCNVACYTHTHTSTTMGSDETNIKTETDSTSL